MIDKLYKISFGKEELWCILKSHQSAVVNKMGLIRRSVAQVISGLYLCKDGESSEISLLEEDFWELINIVSTEYNKNGAAVGKDVLLKIIRALMEIQTEQEKSEQPELNSNTYNFLHEIENTLEKGDDT